MENLPGLAWIKDAGGRYLYANAAAQAAFGKSGAELYGRTDGEIFPPETARLFSANDRAALTSRSGIQTTETLKHPDGTLHYSLVTKFAIEEPERQRTLVGGIAIDVTEQRRAEASLRERDMRISLVQSAGRIGSFDLDVKSGRIYRSPEYLALQGLPPDLSPEGAYSDQWLQRVHPDDRDSVSTWFKEDMARGGVFDREYRIVRADTGETRWIHNRGVIDQDSEGKPERLLSAQSDITERKAAEHALRESEARFREAANSAPAPVWMTGSDGRVEFVNQALEEFAGIKAEGLMGNVWFSFVHPDDLPAVIEQRSAAWAAKYLPYSLQTRFKRVDGEWRWLEVNSKPRIDSAGNFHGYVGLAVDRTDAVRAEAALRESEARYRAVVESQAELVCRFRADGTILFANGAYARASGAAAEALIGQNLWKFVPEKDRANVRARLDGLTPQNPETRIENRVAMIGGERWFLWTNRALAFDSSGKWLEAQSTGIDITERRLAEEHRRLLLDELNHRVKNTLMTVQAIANLSLSSSHSLEELRERFASRLLALSRVHNLLTEENWMGADLGTVLAQGLHPYGFLRDGSGRIRANGPQVPLSAKAAQTFAMAFHELATNAGKYGALSNDAGLIDVSWSYDESAATPFSLTWRESGGPPVRPPSRTGFGSMMIKEILPAEIDGKVSIDYPDTGLICTMTGVVAGK